MSNRDLDAEICEIIFGWTECFKVPKDINGENGGMILSPSPTYNQKYPLPPKGKINRSFFCTNYSGNLSKALDLARYIKLPTQIKDPPCEAEDIARMCLEYYKKNIPSISITR